VKIIICLVFLSLGVSVHAADGDCFRFNQGSSEKTPSSGLEANSDCFNSDASAAELFTDSDALYDDDLDNESGTSDN